MELQQALENIKRVTCRLAKDEINCIREHREKAIPTLLEYVKVVSELGPDLDDDYDAHTYAMLLLAEFRVKEAFPYLLKYLEFNDDLLDWLIGDLLTEDFGAILASVAQPGDISKLKSIVENEGLDEFHRLAALSAMITMYVEGVYEREALVSYLGSLLESFGKDSFFVALLIDACLDIYASEHFDLINALFKQGRVDEQIITADIFNREIMRNDTNSALLELKNSSSHSFITDTIESAGWWACFREKPDFGRKIGRNEPCPCGSGKKYKKCCLLLFEDN